SGKREARSGKSEDGFRWRDDRCPKTEDRRPETDDRRPKWMSELLWTDRGPWTIKRPMSHERPNHGLSTLPAQHSPDLDVRKPKYQIALVVAMVKCYFKSLVILDIFPSHGASGGAIASAKDPLLDLMLVIQVQVISIPRSISIFMVIDNGQFSRGVPTDRGRLVFIDFVVVTGVPSQLERKQQPIFIVDKAAVDLLEGTVLFLKKI